MTNKETKKKLKSLPGVKLTEAEYTKATDDWVGVSDVIKDMKDDKNKKDS
jgi:hypothetical protein